MTYSIVARDPETGHLGVAVQSRAFGTGAVCPWALPGVGAVTTQSFAEVSYGVRGLELLAAGRPPADALEELLAADERRDFRQVACADARGRTAAHTGAACIPECGHIARENVSVQGNMLASAEVWPAMLEAFESSAGRPLGERLLDAMDAGEAAGGDFRGRQAGALLVVSGNADDPPWQRIVDVRVDDHAEPLQELRRLYLLADAYARRRELDPEAARAAGMREDEVELVAAMRDGDVERWIGDDPRRRDTIDRYRRLGYIE